MKTNERLERRETKYFQRNIRESKVHHRKARWIKKRAKTLQGVEEGLNTDIHLDTLKQQSRKYEIGKHKTMME